MAKRKTNVGSKGKSKAKAKATTGVTLNDNGAALAPINSLPNEVLTRIFQHLLSLCAQQCCVEKGNRAPGSCVYPDSLLRVCSHWRELVLASPTLWTHVDIVLSPPTSRKQLERAKAFLKRADQSPLDIHIIDRPSGPRVWRWYNKSDDERSNHEDVDPFDRPGFTSDEEGFSSDEEVKKAVPKDSEVLNFLPSIPTHGHVRSVELVIASYETIPALCQFFANCTSGSLLSLTSRGQTFIQSIDPEYTRFSPLPPANPLHSIRDKLEAAWLSVTALHISYGSLPSMDSSAFKGLIDLRLSSTDRIAESRFVNVLKSSPGLRILKLDLRITEPLPLSTQIEPVILTDLEVLDLVGTRLDGAEFEKLTRWIVPGQKPLWLSLWCPLDADSVKDFFRRSNVIEPHFRLDLFKRDMNLSELGAIISLSPGGLRMLAIDGVDHNFLSRITADTSSDTSHSSPRVKALHLQYCHSIQIDNLRQLAKKYSIQTLAMWSCSLLEGYYLPFDKDVFTLCPVVKRLKRRDYTPMEQWIDSVVI